MLLPPVLPLLLLLLLPQLIGATTKRGSNCTRNYRSLNATINCLPASLALVKIYDLPNSLSCLVFVSSLTPRQCDLCVVQYSPYSMNCTVFALQDVCADVFPSELKLSDAELSCNTFVDSAALTLRRLFDGVWIPSVRADVGLRNLVCRNGVQANFAGVNVVYDFVGAPPYLNGMNSLLNLAQADDFHWTEGLAWLLRIKRYPQSQPYLDHYSCGNGAMGAAMWEWNGPGTLFYDSYGRLLPLVKVETRGNRRLVVETQSQWADLGVTVSNITEQVFMYYNRSFIDSAYFNYSTRIYYGAPSRRCIRFGSSDSANNYWFKGHVKLIALANHYRSASEMNWLFDLFS